MNNYIPFNSDYFSMINPNDRVRIYQAMYPNLQYPESSRNDVVLGNYARQIMRQYPEMYQQLQNNLNRINYNSNIIPNIQIGNLFGSGNITNPQTRSAGSSL